MSPEEFSGLLNSARPRLWLIAAAVLSDRSEADDIVQEAAIVGLEKLGEFSRGTSFEAWMGQIVRNLARNALRKRRTREGAVADLWAARAGGGAKDVGAGELDERLLEGLDLIEETPRVCLLLRVVGDLPYRAIAEVLGIPEGTAMSHVHRARERLRRWLIVRTIADRSRENGARARDGMS